MYRQTIILNKSRTRNVTTRFGQRRILKNKNPNGIVTYIKQAVQAGTYYDEEISRKQVEKQFLERRNNKRRGIDMVLRKKPNIRVSPYGTKIYDYPKIYEILSLNPALTNEMGIFSHEEKKLTKKEIQFLQEEKKALEKLQGKQNLTTNATGNTTKQPLPKMKPLIEKYIKKETKRQQQEDANANSIDDVDLYYKKILGINKPKTTSSMGSKSSLLNKAYVVALKQFNLLRSDPNMTEDESLKIVEELLQKDLSNERQSSRNISNIINNEKQEQTQKEEEEESSRNENISSESKDEKKKESILTSAMPPPRQSTNFNKRNDDGNNDLSSVPSILHNKPRTIKGMYMWSQRLKSVPYSEWTIGATVALDHWIARSILEIDEETWIQLLSGGGGAGNTSTEKNLNLRSIGYDIITVRKSLFPETNINNVSNISNVMSDGASQDDYDLLSSISNDNDDIEKEDIDTRTAADKSIDELLASLGGFDNDNNNNNKDKDKDDDQEDTTSSASDDEYDNDDDDNDITELVEKLQDYRRKHHYETPYDKWSINEQNEFNNWLENKYIKIVLSQADGIGFIDYDFGGSGSGSHQDTTNNKIVDLEQTRITLLQDKPIQVTKDINDKFFNNIQDEANAEILLNDMLKDGPPPPPPTTTATSSVDNEGGDGGENYLVSRYISKFWTDLSYQEQLNKLLELGTIQPLIDEYSTNRSSFMKKHGKKLLYGIELEHLIEDNINGHIKGSEILKYISPSSSTTQDDVDVDNNSNTKGRQGRQRRGAKDQDRDNVGSSSSGKYYSLYDHNDNNNYMNIKEESRYVIKKIPYGTIDKYNHTKYQQSRQLYELWNTHKVNRSLYEEYMFKQGLLGLTYNDDNNNKDNGKNDEK